MWCLSEHAQPGIWTTRSPRWICRSNRNGWRKCKVGRDRLGRERPGREMVLNRFGMLAFERAWQAKPPAPPGCQTIDDRRYYTPHSSPQGAKNFFHAAQVVICRT